MSDKPRLCRWPLHGQVLVVDDDEPYRRIVSLRLQRIGCTCHGAATCEAAIQLLRQNPAIAVAVLDYQWSPLERCYYAEVVADGQHGWVPESLLRE